MSSRVVVTEYANGAHVFSLDGKRVPGVTTLVNLLDKGGLVVAAARESASWATTHWREVEQLGEAEWQSVCATAYRRAWDKAADDGRLVHKLAESLVYGQPLPDADENGQPYPDEIVRMAGQLARFMDTWQVDPVAHEAVVYNENDRWAGRFDLLAYLADQRRWLLDYKTSKSDVYPNTSLQLAAYAHATHIQISGNDVEMPRPERGGVVRIRPDFWQLVPVAIGDSVYETFRQLRPLYDWTRLKRDRTVGEPLPGPEQAAS